MCHIFHACSSRRLNVATPRHAVPIRASRPSAYWCHTRRPAGQVLGESWPGAARRFVRGFPEPVPAVPGTGDGQRSCWGMVWTLYVRASACRRLARVSWVCALRLVIVFSFGQNRPIRHGWDTQIRNIREGLLVCVCTAIARAFLSIH